MWERKVYIGLPKEEHRMCSSRNFALNLSYQYIYLFVNKYLLNYLMIRKVVYNKYPLKKDYWEEIKKVKKFPTWDEVADEYISLYNGFE